MSEGEINKIREFKEVTVDEKFTEEWKKVSVTKELDWIFLSYADEKEETIVLVDSGGNGLEEGKKNVEAFPCDTCFLLVQGYSEIPSGTMKPFDLVVIYIPLEVRKCDSIRKSRACLHVGKIASSCRPRLRNYYVFETSDLKTLNSSNILRSILDFQERQKKSEEEISSPVLSSKLPFRFTHSTKRLLFESFLVKEGKIVANVKKRYHKLTGDLTISYYTSRSEKFKGCYSIKNATIGYGVPKDQKGKKKGLKFGKFIGRLRKKAGTLKSSSRSRIKKIKNMKEKSRLSGLDPLLNRTELTKTFYIQTDRRTYLLQSENALLTEEWLTILHSCGCKRVDLLKPNYVEIKFLRDRKISKFKELEKLKNKKKESKVVKKEKDDEEEVEGEGEEEKQSTTTKKEDFEETKVNTSNDDESGPQENETTHEETTNKDDNKTIEDEKTEIVGEEDVGVRSQPKSNGNEIIESESKEQQHDQTKSETIEPSTENIHSESTSQQTKEEEKSPPPKEIKKKRKIVLFMDDDEDDIVDEEETEEKEESCGEEEEEEKKLRKKRSIDMDMDFIDQFLIENEAKEAVEIGEEETEKEDDESPKEEEEEEVINEKKSDRKIDMGMSSDDEETEESSKREIDMGMESSDFQESEEEEEEEETQKKKKKRQIDMSMMDSDDDNNDDEVVSSKSSSQESTSRVETRDTEKEPLTPKRKIMMEFDRITDPPVKQFRKKKEIEIGFDATEDESDDDLDDAVKFFQENEEGREKDEEERIKMMEQIDLFYEEEDS